MEVGTPRTTATSNWRDRDDQTAFLVTMLLLSGVPLAFSTAIYRTFSLPKFTLLLIGSSALIPLLVLSARIGLQHRYEPWSLLATKHVLLVSLLFLVIAISTIAGVSPISALFGSSYNQMGLIANLCFLVVFASLILTIRSSESRFLLTMWAMTGTGLVVATYAFVQFFDRDPFLHPQSYTFASAGGAVLRITSTIGHSNYLGNFLLYITPVAAGLALTSSGRARRVGFMTAGLSALAIVFTGTRGAWIGLAVATFTLFALSKSRILERFKEQSDRRRIMRWGTIASVLVVVLFAIVALNPASRNIVQRAKSLVMDMTGSGRTLLWRDSLKMIRDYPVLGCGPEGFRKAFLTYKSIALAQHAPDINNESSHNAYIDAAVSYGLPGAILYVAIIASSFSLLLRARRRTTAKHTRVILESLVASLAAVAAHNFFIFDQISTGLYFFAFAALAQAASSVVAAESAAQKVDEFDATGGEPGFQSASPASVAGRVPDVKISPRPKEFVSLSSAAFPLGAAGVLFCVAVWYSSHIIGSDLAITRAIASASAGDLRGLLDHGNRAISKPDPAGDYRFMLAGLLTFYADNAASEELRAQAIAPALSYAAQSAAYTNTPDSNYVLMAYLALRLGHYDDVFKYASEAIKIDPKFSNSHWLLAEVYLARNQREEAASEARFALELNPNSLEAVSALKRARGIPVAGSSEELIRFGRSQAGKGKTKQALRILQRAVGRSNGHCAECRKALAEVYEAANFYQDAIREWQAYAKEAPDRAIEENTALRVEKLREKANLKR